MDILWEQVKSVWSLLSAPLFELGNSQISIASLFVALFILTIFVIIGKILERGVQNALKNKTIDPGIIRFAIDRKFRKGRVTIPFPQRDLHIKTSEPQFNLAYEQPGS